LRPDRDQELAKLFVESEWSQEQLALYLGKRWGKEVERRWVSYHLRLGRFLLFFRTSGSEEWKIPDSLTEHRFRRLWEETPAQGNFSGHRANTEAAARDEQRRFAVI
jgi:hypothetical protein